MGAEPETSSIRRVAQLKGIEPSAASPAIPKPLIPWLSPWLRVFEAYVKDLREIQDNAAVFDNATLGNRS